MEVKYDCENDCTVIDDKPNHNSDTNIGINSYRTKNSMQYFLVASGFFYISKFDKPYKSYKPTTTALNFHVNAQCA